MARVKSPLPLSGKLGPVVFAHDGENTTVRMRPSTNKRRWKTSPRLRRSRENAQNFGGASKAACAIYQAVKQGRKELLMPYAHNKLLRRLRAHARGTDGRRIGRYTFKNAIPALRNLDLSRKGAPTQHIKVQPLGPVHRPDSLRVTGIQDAAAALGLNGNGRCEMRIRLRYLPFPEAAFDHTSKEWKIDPAINHMQAPYVITEWMPVQVVPDDGLLLHLQQPKDDEPVIISLIIEWREVRAVDDEIKPLPHKSVARIAALQYSDALAAELASEDEERRRSSSGKNHPPQPPAPDWQKDPKAFLNFALGALATKPEAIPKTE
jgi:hypothetical protein